MMTLHEALNMVLEEVERCSLNNKVLASEDMLTALVMIENAILKYIKIEELVVFNPKGVEALLKLIKEMGDG
tara:strand:+ start:29 stop:244 length:216 start_codon:yes stop_codon:yes gene_type:complete